MSGEIVSVTWAEKVFNVGNYSSFRVGPFFALIACFPGKTVKQALNGSIPICVHLRERSSPVKRMRFCAVSMN